MLPDYPMFFWILAVVSVLFVGIAKAGFGGGVGILATPLMALAIPVTDSAVMCRDSLLHWPMQGVRPRRFICCLKNWSAAFMWVRP